MATVTEVYETTKSVEDHNGVSRTQTSYATRVRYVNPEHVVSVTETGNTRISSLLGEAQNMKVGEVSIVELVNGLSIYVLGEASNIGESLSLSDTRKVLKG